MPRLTDYLDRGAFGDLEAALDRRLSIDSDAPLALALSGGGDSTALLHLAKAWATRSRRPLLALTVDHGLNPDSAAWTAFAGAAARRVGADWRALPWIGEKPAVGLAAAARLARHRLLANAAQRAGASVILFAHTADDVAEGEAMRAGPAPTLGRLRDWSPSPVWPEGRDIFLCRPLIGVRRSALRHWLSAQELPWLDDPANNDLRSPRARARQALAAAPCTPAQVSTVCAGDLAVIARQVEDRDGGLTITRGALAPLPPETLHRLLSFAVTCAAGAPTPPRGDGLDRLARKLKTERAFVTALNGARIEAGPALVTFDREAGDMARDGLVALAIHAGDKRVWDGRFEIVADREVEIRPLAGLTTRLSKSDRTALKNIPAAARPALPALFQGETVALPRPFGSGPATARALCRRRLDAACGLITHERDISRIGMARSGWSSYVEALALA